MRLLGQLVPELELEQERLVPVLLQELGLGLALVLVRPERLLVLVRLLGQLVPELELEQERLVPVLLQELG